MFVFNFSIGSLKQSVRLGRLVIFRFPWQFPSLNTTFSKSTTKKQCFLQCFHCLSCFSAVVVKENLLKTLAIVSLANFQIFKFCYDIQGLHLIGYLWVSLIIDQSKCLICYFLCTELTLFCTVLTLFCTELTLSHTELTLFCTELTLFCTELPENCIYLNQSKLSNFSMCIINFKIEGTCSISLLWNHKYNIRPQLHDTKFNYHKINKSILKMQNLITQFIVTLWP